MRARLLSESAFLPILGYGSESVGVEGERKVENKGSANERVAWNKEV